MAETASDYSQSTVIFAAARFGGSNPPGPPLQPPGGGGTFDGMEARVARLEADVGHIQRDVAEIKDALKGVGKGVSDLQMGHTELKTHVSYLPSKAFIATAMTGGVGFLLAALTLLSRFGFLVAGTPK